MSIPDDDDGLLKRSLTPNDAVAAGPCLDAETLAAWADASTPIAASDEIERHLASCGRCQAMLAAFAHAEVAEATHATATVVQAAAAKPSNVLPFKSSLPRWVPIALGAMAASLVIYAVWPAQPTPSVDRAEQTIASAPPAPAATPLPYSRPFADAAAPAPKTADVPADQKSPRGAPTKPVGQMANAIAPPQPAPEPLPARPTPAPATVLGSGVTSSVVIAPPPPAAAGASSATAAGASAAAAPPTRPDELVMLRGATEAAKTASSTRVVAEFASPATTTPALGQSLRGLGARGGGGGGRGGLAASTPRPTARVNWRVLASGQVERSVDNGQTWAPVTIAPAVTVITGAAPSASVCWLIGRNGIVLLSTDGLVFRQVRSPDVADLRSIVAINELEATVTTNDGRVFTTVDGGDHWKE